MTNPVHFIAVPRREDSLARAFGEAHRRYTRMRNFDEDVRGYLFQGRFGSCVLDEAHLLAAATGRPAGTEMFTIRVQDLTGRSLEKGKAGRPKKILPK
jgi:hypothetical protein